LPQAARDIDGDGRDDLECRFGVQAARLSAANPVGTQASLARLSPRCRRE
jgi:hypothetical protein